MKEWKDISTRMFCLILLVGWPIIFVVVELILWLFGGGLFSLQGEALRDELELYLVVWIGSVVVMTLLFAVSKYVYNRRNRE